ncbi:hypothetical protein [Naasia lichenicola]|uniref:Right handed beta helix domain-containing protein n=1 Tax=Naasia lichenicola TaxID=2565933 RepID=A0A4S4FN54_9MICO|nr:hypothetical protein [Naasia lichenicola]THG30666.1 hypothetical protein E6C64_08480 [Naasia lichenicola]THG31903.1 hypothetical protein E6C64_07625 [Naasia lichenicola]
MAQVKAAPIFKVQARVQGPRGEDGQVQSVNGRTGVVTGLAEASALPGDATSSVKGLVRLAGDLAGSASSPIVRTRTVSKIVAPTGIAADYSTSGTNDHTVINTAISAVSAAGGGRVVLRAGNYSMNGAISMRSNVWLSGEGVATVLTPTPGGGRTINISNISNARVSNLFINGVNSIDSDKIINIANGSGIVEVDHCQVLNTPGTCLSIKNNNLADSNKIWIHHNRLVGGGNGDVIFGGPDDSISTISQVIIENNFIRQGDLGLTYSPSAINLVAQKRFVIANNVVDGFITLGGEKIPHYHVTVSNNVLSPGGSGRGASIVVFTDSNVGQTEESRFLTITHNHVIGGNIYVQGQDEGAVSYTRNVIIANNQVDGTKEGGVDLTRGINLQHLRDVIVSQNIIDGSDTGVYLYDVHGISFLGNRILNTTTPISTPGGAGLSDEISYHANVGLGQDIQLSDVGDHAIGIGQSKIGAGGSLIIKAADSVIGGTNLGGGHVDIKSGIGTGNSGLGYVGFWTSRDTSSGTTTQIQEERMRLTSSQRGRLIVGAPAGVQTADGLTYAGDTPRNTGVARSGGSGLPGFNHKIYSGQPALDAVDKDAGELLLVASESRGSGTAVIRLQTPTPGISGNSLNSVTDRVVVDSTAANFSVPVLLSGAPTVNLHAATKLYVDSADAILQTQVGSKAAKGANSDITGLSGLTTPLSVSQGGSGGSTSTGSGALVLASSPTITTPAIAQINDTTGAIALSLPAAGLAVNYLQMANGAAGISPSLIFTGSDTNVQGTIKTKGTGALVFRPGGDSTISFQLKQASNTTYVVADSVNQRLVVGQAGAPHSTLQSAGSFAIAYIVKTAAYTLGASDAVVDFTSGTVNATLPTSAGIAGREYLIKNSGTGVITVVTTSSQTIDGASTYSLSTQYKYVRVQSNGANWIVIGNN